MPKVHKTIAQAKANLDASTAYIPERYKQSTQVAEWEAPATSDQSEANWREGLAAAQAADRRRTGIHLAGNAKYRQGCAQKGAGVIGTRIKAALGDYERFMRPVLDAMNAASDAAPPKVRDWRTNVTNRLFPVIEAAIGARKRS